MNAKDRVLIGRAIAKAEFDATNINEKTGSRNVLIGLYSVYCESGLLSHDKYNEIEAAYEAERLVLIESTKTPIQIAQERELNNRFN